MGRRTIAACCAVGAVALIAGLVAVDGASAADRPAHPCRGICPIADRFDFPVGPPDAVGYHDAQPFGERDHLGEDWNGNGGGDSDLGDPVHAIAAGVVVSARDHGGGWGNVVRVVHDLGTTRVESLYAHLHRIEVTVGQVVAVGESIGTIGTAGGKYPAHLHLELRNRVGMPLGGGYGRNRSGHLDPTAFIRATRRPPDGGDPSRAP